MALFSRKPSFDAAPIEGRDLLLADLDGVIYRGAEAIPGAVNALNRASESVRLGFLTNNAARTDAAVAAHLSALGLRATAEDVITSPQAAVALLRDTVPEGSVILVVGGEGVTNELEKAGYRWTRSATDNPAAVVQGFARDVGWEQLAEAAYALQEEPGRDPLPWIATNTDWTLPQERGIAPGNGTLVSAVHTAVQRLPVFAGKPETPIYEAAFERFSTRNVLMLGDRLDTDVRGAIAAGIPSLMVLTGVDRPKQLIAASQDMRPTYIVASLDELHEPYMTVETLRDGTKRVGSSKVRMEQNVVQVVAEGNSPMELLRAGCAAVWASGLAIYGLKVPEILLEDHWR